MAGKSASACLKNCCYMVGSRCITITCTCPAQLNLPWPNIPCHHHFLALPGLLAPLSCSSCSSWSCCSSCYSCSSSRTHEFLRNLSGNVISCAEVSIPQFMNKARGLLEQFGLHWCVYLEGEKSSFLQPSCWDIQKKYPMLEVEGPRNLTPASGCSSFEGSGVSWQMSCVWWIKVGFGDLVVPFIDSSLDHSPRQGMELLKRRWKWRLAEKGRSRLSRPWIIIG